MLIIVILVAAVMVPAIMLEARPIPWWYPETGSILREMKRIMKEAALGGIVCEFFYIVFWIDMHVVPYHFMYSLQISTMWWRMEKKTRLIAVIITPIITQLMYIYSTVSQYAVFVPSLFIITWIVSGVLEIRSKEIKNKIKWEFEFIGREMALTPNERKEMQDEIL